jgi:spore germination cell wall hydrolase CwlJ-like protein
MTQALAVRALSRAQISFLMLGAASSAALITQNDAITRAVEGLTSSAPQAVVVKKPATRVDPNLVQPFYLKTANAAERDRAVRCMTDAIYYEAANEPEAGQRAVAQVIVNRVRDEHFPKSVCGVVYQGWERKSGCQFSFVCDGSIARRRADPQAWDRLRPLAEQALNGRVEPGVGASTHYYASYVRPNWVRSVAKVASIGTHVFCSWKGKAGLPSALSMSYAGNEFAIAEGVLDGLHGPKGLKTLRRAGLA